MKRFTLVIFFISLLHIVHAQPVLVGEYVEAAGLICFPVYGDSTIYKYLPSRGRLGAGKENLPEFSFLQYAVANTETTVSTSSITEANGGGLLHFLALYDTPPEQVRNAERELRRKLKNNKLKLVGPVDITSGKFLLVSSVLKDGNEAMEVIGTGLAPVFQNSKVAFSFLVDPLRSQLLMESFRMAVPDVSLTFDLQFSGLSDAYNGEVVVDWAQVQKSEYSNSSVDALFYSSDVEKTFASLIQTGAITMKSYGNDSIASDMLNIAYDRLLKLMFEPVRPDSIEPTKTRGVLEEIFGRRGLLGGLVGGSDVYRKQVIKTSGRTVVQIDTRKLVDRHHLVTFNLGDLWKAFGDDKRIFRKVALDDRTFQQREVRVNLDGSIKDEFNDMISSVSITLRKAHANGDETVREVFISKDVLEKYDGSAKLIYLNKDDTDRTAWLDYDYMVNWQFKMDGNHVTDWQRANNPIINLYPPYENRQIDVLGDFKKMSADGILAVAVEVSYPFFKETKRERLTIRTDAQQAEHRINAIVPRGTRFIDYAVTWIRKDGKKFEFKGKDEHGIILVDDIPVN